MVEWADPIRAIEIQCTRGVVDFVLSLECAVCGSRLQLTSSNTLLFEEEIQCPRCQAPLRIGFEAIQDYLERHHPALLHGDRFSTADERIAELERRIGAALPGDSSGIPELCKQMHWDYVLLLNQTIVNSLLREGSHDRS